MEVHSASDRYVLEGTIETLEHAARNSTGRLKQLAIQRRNLASRRLDRFDRTEEALDLIAHQLLLIEEIVRFLHQASFAPHCLEEAQSEIEHAISDLDDHEETIRMIAPLDVPEGQRVEVDRMSPYLVATI
jgi:hypothetical protein